MMSKLASMFSLTLCLLLTGSCNSNKTNGPASDARTIVSSDVFPGIRGIIRDAETESALAARVVVKDDSGRYLHSYYSHLPGFFTGEDGSFEQELEPGRYTITVHHGIDYVSQEFEVEIGEAEGVGIEAFLKPWYPLREEGWYNGGGHCHLYTETEHDTGMLAKVRQICLAQGVDFLCAAQGWAGYSDTSWRDGYREYSDERFIFHYGSEMPKYRTGHTWWIGQTSTRGYFRQTMDENYEEKYYQSEHGTAWSFDELKFPYIPDVEVVQQFRKADNAVAIIPHPTSWWWQKRGDIEKYTTNVCSYLSFGLLAGKIWDGLVVMGYNHDHYIYQNLWFHILNQGYRMPAISELDGGLGKNDRFYYGSMRTYYHIDGDFTIQKIADAVRRGETFVTSGPVIMADIDGSYGMGSVISPGMRSRTMHIEALASGDTDDYLSYVVVYRNGEIHTLRDLRKEKPRRFEEDITIDEEGEAWYVVKAYGRKAWEDPEFLDIMKVCDPDEGMDPPDFSGARHDVCITSPFYFRSEGKEDPGVMKSHIDLTLKRTDGSVVENANIAILLAGEPSAYEKVSGGRAEFSMPVHGLLRIEVPGEGTIYRGLYMDYTPHLELLEELASGRWMDNWADVTFSSGEVPWEAFNYERTKEVLADVDWEIRFVPNARDTLRESFYKRFDGDGTKKAGYP